MYEPIENAFMDELEKIAITGPAIEALLGGLPSGVAALVQRARLGGVGKPSGEQVAAMKRALGPLTFGKLMKYIFLPGYAGYRHMGRQMGTRRFLAPEEWRKPGALFKKMKAGKK